MRTFTCIKHLFLSIRIFSKSEKESLQSFSEFLPTARTSLSLSVPINLILNKRNSPHRICLLKLTVGLGIVLVYLLQSFAKTKLFAQTIKQRAGVSRT